MLVVVIVGLLIGRTGENAEPAPTGSAAFRATPPAAELLDRWRTDVDSITRLYPVSELAGIDSAELGRALSRVASYPVDSLAGLDAWRTAAERIHNGRLERATKAREAAERERKARAERTVAAMRKRRDEFKGIVWYDDPSLSRYANTSTFRLYIGKPDQGRPFLRLLLRYSGDNWLFVEQFQIKADDRIFTIRPANHFAVERDNGSGDVWEWYDILAGPEELAIVNAVLDSKAAKVRYEGQQYYRDRTITANERAALRRVLNAYDALSGL